MDQSFFSNKKNLFSLIGLLLLAILLPIGINLSRQQQILRSKASIDPIVFIEGECVQKKGDKLVAICADNIKIRFTSPIGGPGVEPSASPTPSSTPDSSSSPSSSPSPTASPSQTPPQTICNPNEKNTGVIKSTWVVGSCKKIGKREFTCTYLDKNKTKVETREVDDSSCESTFNFVSSVFADSDGEDDSQKQEKEKDKTKDKKKDKNKKQCSDGKDNDGDNLIDDKDPGCHEGDDLSKEYNPNDNDEKDAQRGGVTTRFKYAENPEGLKSAAELPYDQEPEEVTHNFIDPNPGTKTIFVEFIGRDSKGREKKEQRSASIELVAQDPQITSISCQTSSTGTGVILNISGTKFGISKGQIIASSATLSHLTTNLVEWLDTQVLLGLPENSCSDTIYLTLIRVDKAEARGIYGPSPLSAGVKLFCRRPSQTEVSNVELAIIENTTTGAQLAKQTVSIEKDGLIKGISYQFGTGKEYKVSLKAPRSVRRVSQPFVYNGGTVQLILRSQDNYLDQVYYNVLPIGDIWPPESGDGAINAPDKSELNGQWGGLASGSASLRAGDFNLDTVVNSVDWACMRYDFGSSDDAYPTVLVTSTPTPSPTPQGNFTPTPVATPTPEVTTEPSPVPTT